MNRIDRLNAILIQLQTKRKIKAQEIADKFGISLRTVYRDVKALEAAGVPVIGEAGSGYQLMEGYRLPPVQFCREEAAALLTAGKLIHSMADRQVAKQYHSALDKIKAVLRMTEKDLLEQIDNHIAVLPYTHPQYQKPDELHLSTILDAIGQSRVLEMHYHSIGKRERLKRSLEPIGIYYQGGQWYLLGYCRMRMDYRVFRTDRIEQLFLSDQHFTPSHPPLQQLLDTAMHQADLKQVVMDVDPDWVQYLGTQKYYNGFVREELHEGMVRMTFFTASFCGFARWYLMFGDQANIVSPQALKDEVAALLEKISQKVEPFETLLT